MHSKVVAIITEGVPKSDTKQLIAYARANNKVVIGPNTVGGIQAGAFKIDDTAGTIDNIIHCKLYKLKSIGFVSKYNGQPPVICKLLNHQRNIRVSACKVCTS